MNADQAMELRYKAKMNRVMEVIEKAALSGNSDVTVSSLDYDMRDKLENLGYAVSAHGYEDYKISWE